MNEIINRDLIRSKEKRIAQLKACAQTIINSAEKILELDEMNKNWRITINIPCSEVPTIKAEREFVSDEIINAW